MRPRLHRLAPLLLLVLLSPPPGALAAAPAEPSALPQAAGGSAGAQPGGAAASQPLGVLQGPVLSGSTWRRLGERLLESFVTWLPSLAAALIVFVLFFLFYRVAARLMGGIMRHRGADPALQHIALRLLRIVIVSFGIVVAAGQLGFAVGSVIAGLGVAGLAVGLAAQDTLGNLIAGLTILWDRPFRIGDNVTVAGTFGKVMNIGLRSTRIRTVERFDAILPNKDVINAKIVNHTLTPQLRLAVPVGIAYAEDTREARKVLLAAVAGHALIESDPAPQVVVIELADSAVNLELRVWLRDPFGERDAFFELLELVKVALDEAGIEIPFPQRTLHLAGERLAPSLAAKLTE